MNTRIEIMPSDDLSNLEGPSKEETPSGKSAAALEQELQSAKKTISKHNVERVLFVLVLVVVWDAHTFKSYQSWAPTISITVIELVGLFILAYRFEMHEVITLFWAAIRGYAQKDPGDPPG